MTINHLNLIVKDVSKAVSFFKTHFDFSCELIKGEAIIAILKNKENFTLVVMADKNRDATYPKNFHIGFMLDHIDDVDKLYQNLLEGKIEVTQPPGKVRDSYTFYFYFDNLFIEVGHYLK